MSEPSFDPVKILNAQARAIAAVDDGSMSDFEIFVALNSVCAAFVQAMDEDRRANARAFIDSMKRRAHG